MPSQHQLSNIIDQVNDIIEMLSEYEELYVALELAHQLRDELAENNP